MLRTRLSFAIGLLVAASGCGEGELAREGRDGNGSDAAADAAASDSPTDAAADLFGEADPVGDPPVELADSGVDAADPDAPLPDALPDLPAEDPPPGCSCGDSQSCAADGACIDAVEEVPFAHMLLRAEGGQLVQPDGAAVDFRGAISCCMGGYGWPLFDESWVDHLDVYGVNFLHVRLGPFLTGPNGESDWAAVGGGYVETGGQADLAQFNDAFWARVRELIEYAGEHGMWVEVDIADGWAIKHCRWGDIPGYSAWDAAYNVQGEDWCSTGGSREILGDDVHERWVRKVVRETGAYGNVIYQDGNEVGIVGSYAPEWTLSIRNIVRDEEQRNGYLRHLYGTNSEHGTAMGADGVDYIELHAGTAPDASGCYGRPCLSNEYNPDPPLTPEQFHAQYCAAREAGTYFWYWRHGQTGEQMDASLALMSGACP